MSLQRRLRRLRQSSAGPVPPGAAEARGVVATSGAERPVAGPARGGWGRAGVGPGARWVEPLGGEVAGGEVAGGGTAFAEAGCALALENLRAELHRALGRELPRAAPAARLRVGELPLAIEQTAHGPLRARRQVLPESTCVGRVRLGEARFACPASLARVALDPALRASPARDWLYFDTETTGLWGSGALAFLVGLAFFDERGQLTLEQLLLAEPEQERALLERVAQRFASAPVVVSFNGKAYDRPLLDGRVIMQRASKLPARPHLDLLHAARRLHRARVGSCSLAAMERRVLGFDRGPDIEGSEIPAIYARFLRTGDAAGVARVIEHNTWDLLSMVALVGLYGQPEPELEAADLVGLALTQQRAGARLEARATIDRACRLGAGPAARRVRAQLAKASGDTATAAADYAHLSEREGDRQARLELAKLCEHKLGNPVQALHWVQRGTSESPDETAHRTRRLHRKIAQALAACSPASAAPTSGSTAPASEETSP